ncbi:MAG: ATP-dependent Clp protease ATP-binding subunit [Spirochaetota bacterium]|nr:ATP-dependent Clp protease ATP-binding subunit [Spirochaetota bacterium]
MYNFTKRSKKVLDVFAQSEGRRLNSDSLGPEHIMLALLKDDDSVAARILKNLGVNFKLLQSNIERSVRGQGTTLVLGSIPINMRYNRIIEIAKEESQKLRNSYLGTEHLLLAIFKEGTCAGVDSLLRVGINYNIIKSEIKKILGVQLNITTFKTVEKSKTPTLNEFAQDLTLQALNNELDPVIGRTEEITRVIRTLTRKRKNNPILIGEAGVGKTAIVEGLAQRIIDKDVPEPLYNKKVMILDLAAVVAGTKFRGEFEDRLKKIMKEIKESNNIIIFIDELHTVIGAGAAEGAIDAANILKPSLARGELRCIGATTIGEYKMHIEKDAALDRRFQSILVEEPSIDETIDILIGLKERYETHHKVKYSEDSLIKAAVYSFRYIQDRFLPDKAIDIIDEAGSKVRLENCSKPEDIVTLEEEIENLDNKKNNLVGSQAYELAASVRDIIKEKRAILEAKISDWQQRINEYELIVDTDEIAAIVSQKTGIPIESLQESEAEKLLKMEEKLHRRIIGQNDAINVVSKAIRRSRIGLKGAKGPIGSFMFLGPTGVGKTELAKTLAEFLFDDENALIRLDMSEYMEKHSVSRLIGAPPGYVGYEEGGQITEKIKRKPYSIILFDEIEKAHIDVLNTLLQIMEEGELTDSFGTTVSFKDAIIIMTSNIGNREFHKTSTMGFESEIILDNDEKVKVFDELKRIFSPEFINRIGEIVYFHKLGKKHVRKIVDIMLDELNTRLEDRDLELIYSSRIKGFLSDKGYDEKYGARHLRRTIQSELEDPLAYELIEGKHLNCKKLYVGIKGNSIYFKEIKTDVSNEDEQENRSHEKEEVGVS